MTPRSSYVGLVVMTTARWGQDPDATITSLGAIEEQAAGDWRMSQRDVDVVHELVDAWIREIRNQEGDDGKRVEGTTPG